MRLENFSKLKVMVFEINDITPDNLQLLLQQMLQQVQQQQRQQQQPKKTLGDIYGKLKRGVDGLEYQKAMRSK